MDFQDFLTTRTSLIEQKLDLLLPEKNVPYRIMLQAARYSLLNGGKRLRPLLTLAVAETLGADPTQALVPACALEMVHTYSLIHDDLPCMDDDDFRRGKPTLHKAFPEGHAVLAGDFLMTYAFDLLVHDNSLVDAVKLKLLSLLSRRSGLEGMIVGQVMDIEAEGKEIDIEQLRLTHCYKTGALLLASVEFGGVIGGATSSQMEALRAFGRDIGLAFQIIDDVLDVTSSQQKHGRAVASDVINGKATYVSLMGLERAREMAYQLLESSKKELNKIPESALLSHFAELLVQRKS